MNTKLSNVALVLAVATTALCLTAASSMAAGPIVGLITKTNTNPFFVKMKDGAQAKANELGAELRGFAGDNDAQVAAIESLIAAHAKGILIAATDPAAITSVVKKARDAGILVIALDTPLNPIGAADMTFATDNFKAGELGGEWAKATLGAGAQTAKIAMLNGSLESTVDVLRDQGFLKGFGIDLNNPNKIGDESDPRIVGHTLKGDEDGGRESMETLLQKNPNINVVYTINEPTAAGAYEAIKASGKTGILLVSIDGGCPGVGNVKAGVIGATSMQFPLLMASKGVEAVVEFAKSGKKPAATEGLSFFDTGVDLITDKPIAGVPSDTSAVGLTKCWG
jgi:fructose transport system substrate-binding protein